jgi:hypothetical protein
MFTLRLNPVFFFSYLRLTIVVALPSTCSTLPRILESVAIPVAVFESNHFLVWLFRDLQELRLIRISV